MTPKQEAFVREYLLDLNATQAAIRAGYSERTANEQAARLLANVSVRSAVEQARKDRLDRLNTTADDVVREIARLAMIDPSELVGVTGPKDIPSLPENVRRAIVGWGWDKHGNFTMKLAKEAALQMLGRHHGLFTDKVEHDVPKDGPLHALLQQMGKSSMPVVPVPDDE